MHITKFWRIRVPTRDSFSSRVLKVCNLSRVEARYWKPKIVFSRSTNTSPVPTRSNIIVDTQILIRVMTFFSKMQVYSCLHLNFTKIWIMIRVEDPKISLFSEFLHSKTNKYTQLYNQYTCVHLQIGQSQSTNRLRDYCHNHTNCGGFQGTFFHSSLYRKDTEPLYHSFMYSLISLLSGIYPLPAMHSLLVTFMWQNI